MGRLWMVCLALTLAAGWSSAAIADDMPWNQEGDTAADKPAEGDGAATATGDKPAVDLKAELSQMQYQRGIMPILAQIEQADKVMDLYKQEMAKPEKRRSEAKALGYKDRAARFYLAAALKAKQAGNLVQESALRDAITQQYHDPSVDKAATIYNELAEYYMQQGDVRKAIAYYRKTLSVDKENETAKTALKDIEAKAKAALAAQQKGPADGGGGSGENERVYDPRLRDWEKEGRDYDRDATKTGRDAEGWKKGGY